VWAGPADRARLPTEGGLPHAHEDRKVGNVTAFSAGLDLFDAFCRQSKLAPFIKAANGLRSWREEIINCARTAGAMLVARRATDKWSRHVLPV
jgi:hypothetical protein